jgi:hypothetical protein
MLGAAPVPAQSPRDLLTHAAFEAKSKPAALSDIASALDGLGDTLKSQPRNQDALLQKGIAIGYRAKLSRSIGDARSARQIFETVTAADPRNGEAQIALACWNLDAIDELGGFLARTAIGARRKTGEDALARAVQLGGNSPLIMGMAAMVTIRDDESAVGAARALAERAMKAQARTKLDQYFQQNIPGVLQLLRTGQGTRAAALARQRLPFGSLPK